MGRQSFYLSPIDKKASKVSIGGGEVRHHIVLSIGRSAPDTDEATAEFWAMLQYLHDYPHLLLCGPVMAQKVRMFHSPTEGWVVEGEAVAHEQE